MSASILKVHPDDNVMVALRKLQAGETVMWKDNSLHILENIPQKHKFSLQDLAAGDELRMYGVPVGKAVKEIYKGTRISRENTVHAAEKYTIKAGRTQWEKPVVTDFSEMSFQGYHRADGRVGTRNYWLVIPLVFCENRNIKVIREAMLAPLGYQSERNFSVDVASLVSDYKSGAGVDQLLEKDILQDADLLRSRRTFPNVDGIKFLTHDGGCGGIRQDSEMLCRLLAGYMHNPNVAGATILSLGCQMAQVQMFLEILHGEQSSIDKPIYILEQQASSGERAFIAEAVKKTFAGLIEANEIIPRKAGLHHLCLGLECGGSDGFSGISANPALGYCSDLLVALGGTAILSEFPELNGVEQELINRCVSQEVAEKFARLMQSYAYRAERDGSGFDMNPSPGNIRDGLITDAMKSAGAAKKGGTSPITAVLDYAEPRVEQGLQLLCTPGNDVESTTGLAGSGANLIAFTTGLGTPTGNPIAPTMKISSNSELAKRMPDLIDFNAGAIISGESTIEEMGRELFNFCIKVANREILTKAELLGQDDFIPWKRGISL